MLEKVILYSHSKLLAIHQDGTASQQIKAC